MRRFDLHTAQQASGMFREWLYSAIDPVATRQVFDAVWHQMGERERRAHNFYMAIQSAAVDMTLRGILVDEKAHKELSAQLAGELETLTHELQNHTKIAPIWDKLEKETGECPVSSRKDGKHTWEKGIEDGPGRHCVSCGTSRMRVRAFNPNSDDDLIHLFYDLLGMKPQHNKDGKVTANKETRGRLANKYPEHEALVNAISTYADTKKQLEFLGFRISPFGRYHAAFNVGVTGTHRWSSNKDHFKQGANAQNITERHRHIFIADPGKELCYADLKQAESFDIAHEAGDEGYIEAHVTGDTHTYVTRLIWQEGVCGKEWTWDIGEDKKIATSCEPEWDARPGHDFRFQSKSIQHGSNLGLTPFGMAIQKHIPVKAATDGQERYFTAFPGIRDYQRFIRGLARRQMPIDNVFGVRFRMLGRPNDEHTYKQALAIRPQSTVGHVVSIGCYRILTELPEVELLAQVHDAILFQFPKGRYELVYDALEMMKVALPIKGVDGKVRVAVIGTEAAVGHNWGHHDPRHPEHNPEGIAEISFTDRTTWKIKRGTK